MAKQEKEKCPKCNSTVFAVAKDKSGKRYCQHKGCGHVWAADTQGLGRVDIVLMQAQKENQELKLEITKVRKENEALKAELEKLKPAMAPATGPTESEIFS